jgi:hypothetical protein
MEQTKTEKQLPFSLKAQLYVDSLLEVKKEKRTLLEIIYWWEIKRIPYNLILVTLGYLSIKGSHFLLNLDANEHVYEFDFLIASIIFFNIAYSLSCVSELFIKKSTKYAPNLFKKGLVFCALIYILPVLLHLNTWIFNVS